MNKLFIMSVIVICLTSCAGKEDSTVVLSPFTTQIVDLFITTGMCEPHSTIEIVGYYTSHNMVELHLEAPPEKIKRHGLYCGYTYCKGHRVDVWENSIDGFFGTSKEMPYVVEQDTTIDHMIYDPCDWYICIDMSDTTVRPLLCYFPCGFPLPVDTLSAILNNTK